MGRFWGNFSEVKKIAPAACLAPCKFDGGSKYALDYVRTYDILYIGTHIGKQTLYHVKVSERKAKC